MDVGGPAALVDVAGFRDPASGVREVGRLSNSSVGAFRSRSARCGAVYLFLKFGIAVGARWPVTDADEIANNQERFDHTVRGGLCTALITAFFTAALPEEVLYRSVVLAAQRRKSGTWISVSVVAVLALAVFAWVHIGFGTGNVVSGLVVGALCTAIALYTRSLWPAIVVHGVYNAVIMVSWALSV
ncbi:MULTISPECIES: CPBP family intramembrane glutamic endopeptidase [Rhodococcus]|uniref:CPBP family intramembrane glutamic endopeptidase n=1 Tax=Rhodococcus TaxID=1827 RepID=UPI0009B8EB23|nr:MULTISPECIES: CPBP family intramembrane glutamic endopeptidase [Rhodococcus]